MAKYEAVEMAAEWVKSGMPTQSMNQSGSSPGYPGTDRDIEIPQPFIDSSSGEIAPVEDEGYVSPSVDSPDNDLVDEQYRDEAMRMPEGID